MDANQKAQQQPVPWLEMGRAQLDDKGRMVIPALVRQSAFGDQERPEVSVYLSPRGYILLQPLRPKIV